jgi:hypothetical protein
LPSLYTIHKKKKENFFCSTTQLGTNNKKKSFTTNATIEQKHQSLLKIGFFALWLLTFGFHLHHHHMSTAHKTRNFYMGDFTFTGEAQHIKFLIDILTFNNWFCFFLSKDMKTRSLFSSVEFALFFFSLWACQEICMKHNYLATLKSKALSLPRA